LIQEGTINTISQLKEGNWKFYNKKRELKSEDLYISNQQTGTLPLKPFATQF